MIDHFTLSVADMARSKAFYTEALKPLGYSVRMDFGSMVGFGDAQKPYFWLKQSATPSQPMHIAFEAKDRTAVDAFHAAALRAGASDDGAPGVRGDYHPNYYAAFVVAVDGHPLEAVSHAPVKKTVKKTVRKATRKAASKPAARKSAPRRATKKPAKATAKKKARRGRR
jgi:catechol 2,3-dioxygenase-like lactoylglutathione lyase family enzyme